MPDLTVRDVVSAGGDPWNDRVVTRREYSEAEIEAAVASKVQIARFSGQDPKLIMVEKRDGRWFISTTADD